MKPNPTEYNPFKELVIEELMNFFNSNPTAQVWHGTATQFFQLMRSNPLNDGMIKRHDNLSIRGIFQDMVKEGLICSESATGVWTLPRSVFQPQQQMNTTIHPNTLAERIEIRRAIARGETLQANSVGNTASYETGWVDCKFHESFQPDFSQLRFRVKQLSQYTDLEGNPAPLPDYNKPAAVGAALTERELLAIMSAVICSGQEQSCVNTSLAVTHAKRILHEIDLPV